MPMYASVRGEVPEFLKEQAIYCANIVTGKKLKSTLVLTRQAVLYEFRNKMLLNQIDLSNTCLGREKDRLRQYDGDGQWFATQHENEEETKVQQKSAIKFGKYIYMKCNALMCYYVLLQCWQQLVVIQRLGENGGFRTAAEYADMLNYEVIHGASAYQPVVRINQQHGMHVETDFQEALQAPPVQDDKLRQQFAEALETKERLSKELQMASDATKWQFMQVRNQLAFGKDLVRSSEIHEKQALNRYGDVWCRLTSNHKLVIGVPLVNNCTPPNLSILKNMRAILVNTQSRCTGDEQYSYAYRLYQLKMRFESLESLESFFQCDEAPAYEASGWHAGSPNNQMPPDTFAVLVLVLDLADAALLHECALYIGYDIERNLQLHAARKPKIVVFGHQLFVRRFKMSQILAQHAAHSLRFEVGTLHQDLLAVVSASHELKLKLSFGNVEDAERFEQVLGRTFQCELVKRAAKLNASSMIMMQLEEKHEFAHFPHMLWYNKHNNSMWHGLMVVREAQEACDDSPCIWKFYTPSTGSSLLLLRMLLDDLLRLDINLRHITCVHDATDCGMATPASAALFEAIKLELQYVNDVVLGVDNVDYNQHLLHMKELLKLQLITDQVMCQLHASKLN